MCLPLIVGVDDSGEVIVCIDRSHAVHVGGKGHSGMFAMMVRGATMSSSKNLGVATKVSTETEVASNREFSLSQRGSDVSDWNRVIVQKKTCSSKTIKVACSFTRTIPSPQENVLSTPKLSVSSLLTRFSKMM